MQNGKSSSSLFTNGSLSLKIVRMMILAAFLTIVSPWLKNLHVIASSGKLFVRAFMKNFIVVLSMVRASAFKNEMKVSTSSSS